MAYYFLLFILLVALVPYIAFFFRSLLVQGLGLPPEFVGLFLLLSLVGSSVNVPLTEIESQVPLMVIRDFRFFGVRRRIPRLGIDVRKTLVAINVGGTLLPLAVCVYMLLWSIPAVSPDLLMTYSRLAVVLLIVTMTVKRSSRLIKGIGIATPAFVPPLTTALATMLLHIISPTFCPTQIAYIGGRLGTLIGADLLNLRRISELGVPMVSIGGAGTFDGIYTTGLTSVVLVLLLL
jgi:uncharacterized membrane protein